MTHVQPKNYMTPDLALRKDILTLACDSDRFRRSKASVLIKPALISSVSTAVLGRCAKFLQNFNRLCDMPQTPPSDTQARFAHRPLFSTASQILRVGWRRAFALGDEE